MLQGGGGGCWAGAFVLGDRPDCSEGFIKAKALQYVFR